jgi:hypothetical protein
MRIALRKVDFWDGSCGIFDIKLNCLKVSKMLQQFKSFEKYCNNLDDNDLLEGIQFILAEIIVIGALKMAHN